MQPTSSSIVQHESECIFNTMEQVCVYNYIVMVYVLTCVLQEIITAFNENFHICCNEDDNAVQSEEEILKWFNMKKRREMAACKRQTKHCFSFLRVQQFNCITDYLYFVLLVCLYMFIEIIMLSTTSSILEMHVL